MRSKIFGIKKTLFLRISFAIYSLLFILSLYFIFSKLKSYDLWFYSFCFYVGIYQLTKAMLLVQDSSCYIGGFLLTIGLSGFGMFYFRLYNIWYLFLILSFFIASFFTFIRFKYKSHLTISIYLLIELILSYFLQISALSLTIFIAFNVIILLSLCIFMFTKKKERNN